MSSAAFGCLGYTSFWAADSNNIHDEVCVVINVEIGKWETVDCVGPFPYPCHQLPEPGKLNLP